MIILIGSQKGGCGKSTTCVNLAVELAQQGKDVVIVDADRQSTASNWVADRIDMKHKPIIQCIQKYDNIRETLLDLKNRYEFVIVDAAGRDSRELRTGMTAADLLVVPFRPSQPDLDTMSNLQDIIIQAKDLNPDLKVKGVLTMASSNPGVREDQEAREYMEEYQEIQLIESIIHDRKVYRDAMSEGLSVIEMSNIKAKSEIEKLAKEIFNG